jgi:hypothetical protein
MKPHYVLLFVTAVLAFGALPIRSVPLLTDYIGRPGYAASTSRKLDAVNQSSKYRGSISVYDIDLGHRLTFGTFTTFTTLVKK